jgi:hypothetical protein
MLPDGLTLISHWLSGDLVGWGGEGWHELQGILGGISGIYLAIGVVIGAAFGKIVSSFVNDILTPILGLLVGGISFSDILPSLTLRVQRGLRASSGSLRKNPPRADTECPTA